jgi:SPP1 gp7 family putative phage head morphogenesis protein
MRAAENYSINCSFYKDKTVNLADSDFKNNPYKLNKKIAESTFKRRFSGGKINPDLYNYYYNKLTKAVEEGGIKLQAEYGEINWEFQQNLRYNVASFSAFKAFKCGESLEAVLFNKDGTKKEFAQFYKDAQGVLDNYNKNWLRAEYNRAVRSARMAADWQNYQETKHLYPNLRYIAVNDERTRAEHAKLNGAIYPIDHPFWDEHFPPNDWGCRCTAVRTSEAVNMIPGIALKSDFANNPGKTGKIFTPDHPYIATTSEAYKGQIQKFVEGRVASVTTIKQAHKQFSAYNTNEWIPAYFNSLNGGYNVYHKGHNINKKSKGWKYEKTTGKLLANQGYRVEFLDESANYKGGKPDLRFIGQTWDVKSGFSSNEDTLRRYIRDTKLKADNLVFLTTEQNKGAIINATNRERGRDSDLILKVYYITEENGLLKFVK